MSRRTVIALAVAIVVLSSGAGFLLHLMHDKNLFAGLPAPIRLTGTVWEHEIDEGPERAAAFQKLISRGTKPGQNKCAMLGKVTFHYASGESRTIRVGCCTAWIDGESWHVGGSAVKNFFPRPAEN